VRLIDSVFRQGHLSERALVDAIISGDRPHHLDRCDICATRTTELARWMQDLQTDAVELADEIFTPERLTAQQDQILRRLQQIDHPARVIAFPASMRREQADSGGRRVAVSWVGVAAAAGLAIGLIGGQFSARLTDPVAPAATTTVDAAAAATAESQTAPVDAGFLLESFDTVGISALDTLDDMTPRLAQLNARSGG
jgi:hypothetical protein